MADNTSAPPTGGLDLIGQMALTADQLREAREQALHYAKLLTVFADRVGPIQVTASEYEAADPTRFGGWSEMAVFGPDDPNSPMTFGFWDTHCTVDGLTTREPQLTKVLEQYLDAEPPVQARAVLTALGLPVPALEG